MFWREFLEEALYERQMETTVLSMGNGHALLECIYNPMRQWSFLAMFTFQLDNTKT